MKISNLMTKTVQTCRSVDTLAQAVQLMWDHDIGAVPVVDESGHVVGILTDRDACMAALTRGEPLHAIAVRDTMTLHPVTCTASAELGQVERKMRDHQVHRMPVVDDDGHPVGIVSLNDIACASQRNADISAKEVAATLAAVGAPRLRFAPLG
jgi:CBS domain-containing protein